MWRTPSRTHAILGIVVVDESETFLGRLAEIIETGANDVYRLTTPDDKELLIPALEDVVVSIDLTARRMVVDGQEVYSFSTLWNTLTPAQRRLRVDPFEERFWQAAPLKRK